MLLLARKPKAYHLDVRCKGRRVYACGTRLVLRMIDKKSNTSSICEWFDGKVYTWSRLLWFLLLCISAGHWDYDFHLFLLVLRCRCKCMTHIQTKRMNTTSSKDSYQMHLIYWRKTIDNIVEQSTNGATTLRFIVGQI